MRTRDWYFHGWERRTDENGRSAFVYTGEYYTLPGGSPKTAAGVLTGALAVVYLTTALLPSEGGMWRIAAVPQLLALIPLIYLILGCVCLFRSKQPMTYRDWYASWRRMRVSAAAGFILTACMTAVQLVFLFSGSYKSVGSELFYLFRTAVCAALNGTICLFLYRHPCDQTVSPG